MRRSFLVFILFLLAACTPKPVAQNHFSPGIAPEPIVQSTRITTTLSPGQVAKTSVFADAFWTAAIDQGMADIGNAYIQLAPLVRGIDIQSTALPFPELLARSGKVHKKQDPQTGNYHQDATVTASFTPRKQLAGEITSLHDNRYLGSTYDRAVLRMYTPGTIIPPAFFLIAQKVSDKNLAFFKISGWGKIVQSMQDVLPDPQHGTRGALYQAELMETSREIEPGDIVFLLQVHATALSPQTSTITPTAPTSSEVTVEPTWEQEPELPKESK
jgi:hypothetical protein